jgi:hypothetical protein
MPRQSDRLIKLIPSATIHKSVKLILSGIWSHPPGSNRRPADYESRNSIDVRGGGRKRPELSRLSVSALMAKTATEKKGNKAGLSRRLQALANALNQLDTALARLIMLLELIVPWCLFFSRRHPESRGMIFRINMAKVSR